MMQTHRVLATLATPVEVLDVDLATNTEMYVVRSVLQSACPASVARIVVRRNGVVVIDDVVEVLSKEGQVSTVNAVASDAFPGTVGDAISFSIQVNGQSQWIDIELKLTPVKGKRRSFESDHSDELVMAS